VTGQLSLLARPAEQKDWQRVRNGAASDWSLCGGSRHPAAAVSPLRIPGPSSHWRPRPWSPRTSRTQGPRLELGSLARSDPSTGIADPSPTLKADALNTSVNVRLQLGVVRAALPNQVPRTSPRGPVEQWPMQLIKVVPHPPHGGANRDCQPLPPLAWGRRYGAWSESRHCQPSSHGQDTPNTAGRGWAFPRHRTARWHQGSEDEYSSSVRRSRCQRGRSWAWRTEVRTGRACRWSFMAAHAAQQQQQQQPPPHPDHCCAARSGWPDEGASGTLFQPHPSLNAAADPSASAASALRPPPSAPLRPSPPLSATSVLFRNAFRRFGNGGRCRVGCGPGPYQLTRSLRVRALSQAPSSSDRWRSTRARVDLQGRPSLPAWAGNAALWHGGCNSVRPALNCPGTRVTVRTCAADQAQAVHRPIGLASTRPASESLVAPTMQMQGDRRSWIFIPDDRTGDAGRGTRDSSATGPAGPGRHVSPESASRKTGKRTVQDFCAQDARVSSCELFQGPALSWPSISPCQARAVIVVVAGDYSISDINSRSSEMTCLVFYSNKAQCDYAYFFLASISRNRAPPRTANYI
jgi:hypothetical protein